MARKLGVVLLIVLLLLLVIPLGIGMVMAPCPDCDLGSLAHSLGICFAVLLGAVALLFPRVAGARPWRHEPTRSFLLIRDLVPPPRSA